MANWSSFFVAVATLAQCIGIKLGRTQFLGQIFAVALVDLVEQRLVFSIAAVDGFEQLLDFGIGIEAARLFLEHVVGAHAAESEIPDALLIFSAVGVRVEVAWSVVATIFEQAHQEE